MKTRSTSIMASAVQIMLFCAPVVCLPGLKAAAGGGHATQLRVISFALRSLGTLA
jgi:hypothetical protein